MDGGLMIDHQFEYDDEYKEYIVSIIKPYRTRYEKFAVIGDRIIASNFFNTFFLEIYPIKPKIDFGFRIETEGKDILLMVDPPIMAELMDIYYRIHNLYMQNKIYESINLIEDNEEFSEINSHSSSMKSDLFKVNDIVTSMNGSYIKLNKSDIVSLNIYNVSNMYNLFDYCITKNKTKLFYHLISLNMIF